MLSTIISLLYMFRATICPSSGEITVSKRHWYLSLCMGGVASSCVFSLLQLIKFWCWIALLVETWFLNSATKEIHLQLWHLLWVIDFTLALFV